MNSVRPIHRSWVPKHAEERVTETYPSGAKKRAEYAVDGEIVGYRWFYETGELMSETPIRDGKHHGTFYRWDEPGIMLSAEPYREDLPHGTARQWDRQGRLLGTYTMRRGTGLDLWWQDWEDGTATLREVHPKLMGDRHGFEWWLSHGSELWEERHWVGGRLHGIEREWKDRAHFYRGYPKFWVRGTQVTRARYLRAALKDSTLPPFRLEDNCPEREFPPAVAAVLTLKLHPIDGEWRAEN